MFSFRGLAPALLLLSTLFLSSCGLKYDLYLPEDETNIQAQQPVSNATGDVSSSSEERD